MSITASPSDLLPLPAAARLIGVSGDTLREHIRQGTIPAIDVGTATHNAFRVYRSDIAAFLESRKVQVSK